MCGNWNRILQRKSNTSESEMVHVSRGNDYVLFFSWFQHVSQVDFAR